MAFWFSSFASLSQQLKGVPRPVLYIIGLLVVVNLVVWAACGITLHFNPQLISSAVLSYTFGLRHAFDADHITAIDLMTRRLIASGQKPVTVGTFFSLGHSTVVCITCIVVAATSGALRDRFDNFEHIGGIIGTSISVTFLVVLCAANIWILCRLISNLRQELRRPGDHLVSTDADHGGTVIQHQAFEGVGCLSKVFKSVFRIVDRPWKMYPVGFVFGLGLDTSSEVALLGIASLQGVKGTSIWLILIFPILFTAGMCLIDTIDGAMMMVLYTSKAFARDLVAILYYSAVLTGVTIFISAFIAIIQILNLADAVGSPEGPFWDGLHNLGEHWDVIGGAICGLFLLVGLGSIFVYGPWKRRMESLRGEPSTNEAEAAM